MYAQLGNIVFEGLYSPESFTENDRATFAEHALINRKPLLEATGLELKELEIGLLLRQDFCNVKNELAALNDIRNAQKPVPLIWGTGENMGVYVITEQTKEYIQQLPDGTTISARVNLRLKEYVEADPIKRIQKEQKQNAQAVKQNLKRKAQVKKTNKPNCSQQVAKRVSDIEAQVNEIGRFILPGIYNQQTITLIVLRTQNIESVTTAMILEIDKDETSCTYKDADLRLAATTTSFKSADIRQIARDNPNHPNFILGIRNVYQQLQGNVKFLKMKANKYIVNSIIRR